jgi:hypothetical protein
MRGRRCRMGFLRAPRVSTMTGIIRRCVSIVLLALTVTASFAGGVTSRAGVSAENIAHVKPGTAKTEVTALLGAPWRTVQYNDVDRLEDEIWEYRGRDAGGAFRLHIEFDARGFVTLIKKIPDAKSESPK